jgi:hypothetical protein
VTSGTTPLPSRDALIASIRAAVYPNSIAGGMTAGLIADRIIADAGVSS